MLFHQRHHHGHFGHRLVGAGAIGLVHHEDVADLHDAGFDGLDVVAHPRNQDHHVRLHRADHFHFVLTDADRLHQDDVEAGGVEKVDHVIGGLGQPSQEAASGHGANEDAAVGVEVDHADAIAEDRAAGEG